MAPSTGKKKPKSKFDFTLTQITDTFDDDGDLTLVVGIEESRFTVCSRTLSRSSPVFKRMLNGPFIERRPPAGSSEPWTVNLPSDNFRSMAIVLNIIHGRFIQVPCTLNLQTFCDVLIFTDKYDMTRVLAPWVKNWMPDYDYLVASSYRMSIQVAWEVGAIKALKAIAHKLTMKSGINPDGSLYADTGGFLSDQLETAHLALIPPGFFESVKAARRAILDGIFSVLGRTVSDLEALVADPDTRRPDRPDGYCTRKESFNMETNRSTQRLCHATTLGFLHALLGDLLKYAPGPSQKGKLGCIPENTSTDSVDTAVSYTGTVEKALQKMKDFKCDLYKVIHKVQPGFALNPLANCSPMPIMLHEIDVLVDKLSPGTLLSGENITRMNGQQRKLGVNWDR